MRSIHLLFPLLLVAACGRDESSVRASSKTADRDNTAVNARDRDGSTLTPVDQSNSAADLDLLQCVRKAITAESTLSTTAKNVKVITRDGRVVLRGTVPTAAERTRIEELANACSGVTSVDNQIETENR